MRISAFVLLMTLATAAGAYADPPAPVPTRNATAVKDVANNSNVTAWVVSPDEEPANDSDYLQEFGVDLRGVKASYDERSLRFDLILYTAAAPGMPLTSYSVTLYFGEGTDDYDVYNYDLETGKLTCRSVTGGKVMSDTTLEQSKTGDSAGVIGEGKDVFFIINKKAHLGGKPGQKYTAPMEAYSFFGVNFDKTMKVNVAYVW